MAGTVRAADRAREDLRVPLSARRTRLGSVMNAIAASRKARESAR